jgi:hypothetical protein
MATRFSGGRSHSTRREPPTMDKQLVNVINRRGKVIEARSTTHGHFRNEDGNHLILDTSRESQGRINLLKSSRENIYNIDCFTLIRNR